MVIVFRGTETTKEWIENANVFMEQLDGEPPESGLALLLNRDVGQLSLPVAKMYMGACHGMFAFAARILQGGVLIYLLFAWSDSDWWNAQCQSFAHTSIWVTLE